MKIRNLNDAVKFIAKNAATRVVLVGLVSLAGSTTAFASSVSGSVEAGKTKAATCAACHGEGGAKPIAPDYPLLAGQHPDYILAALQQYKSGKRKNASMNGFAAALKTQDMKDLAVYFAAQPSPLRSKY